MIAPWTCGEAAVNITLFDCRTWWLLTSYFLIATIASYRSLTQPKTAKQTVDRLEFAVIAVLHVAVAVRPLCSAVSHIWH